jgi:hypothetical protein
MPNLVYDVYTDLDPKYLTEVAIATFEAWLSFALGKSSLGGKTLKFPSGRYAASLSWKKTGNSTVSIMSDEGVSPESNWIESGAPSHSMRDAMLGGAGTKTSAAGYEYRVIPIRQDASAPTGAPQIVGNPKTGQRMSAKGKRAWAQPRAASNPDHFAVMSNAPGASEWIVPAMPAYAPAMILSQLISIAAVLAYG